MSLYLNDHGRAHDIPHVLPAIDKHFTGSKTNGKDLDLSLKYTV